jgi:deazaflavin-dependent oxidoreductase (nitroreductase family)
VNAAATPRIRFLRPFTKRVINPVTRLFAGWLPGFAILTHVGRKSGRTYRTPINVFRRGDHYLFALTYGADVDWVKNVLAAGGCELQTRGRTVRLADPCVSADPAKGVLPLPLRWAGSVVGLTEFLHLQAVG